ncbi:hypothetical protein QLQ12_07370 [Actinoplanes sp. NEAU-A12]|uniref:DUF2157 domain-containing protein n=1 Tax=Actinoplanes sandaracinus TaxID=3045177 RepID=A0ABT6WFE8_9ACTN|nr:hypothetical protein [Actinoplanes sandaracinus]MDI6098420.1 hypothetical protein [Actinoplanes sandaracinus]
MNNDTLERRYRTLLRSYPAGYRRERADELLEILIGEAAHRRWPQPRQAAALVRGGLRVRAGSAAGRPKVVLLWQGMHLAAMGLLALGALKTIFILAAALTHGGGDLLRPVLHEHGPALALGIAAFAALALDRQRLATGLVLAAIAAQAVVPDYPYGHGMPQWWAAVVAAPLVIAGLRRPADVPRVGPRTAVAVSVSVLALVLVLGLARIEQLAFDDDATPTWLVVAKIATAAAFLWVATADRRMLIAVAPMFVLMTLAQITFDGLRTDLPRVDAMASVALGVAIAAGMVAAAQWRHVRL